ncbi:MAG: 1,4-beta-N-acetylmuramidase, partial [Ruminococcus sp.]|nr:1,4-beta-N-acetylmuramidase [Ruminococcus sp.]
MATSGIDVSQWQGTINWPQVKGKVDFALIRAGYGDTLSFPYQIDKMYEANYKGCKQAGIPVGVYFYSYASTVAQAQREADSCIALLKGKQFEYPVYYDVEEFDIFRSGNTNAIIKAFCDKLEKAGYFTGIYIYRSALQTYVNKQIRERYAVAVAEYGPKCNYDGPYGIWQNTSDWSCSGISGRVDHDYCYVDYPKIIREAGMNGFSKTVPTVKPTPAPKPAKKTVEQIARDVIAGDWGAGEERRKRLTAAGYDYDAVQNKVNEILYGTKPQPAKKSIDQIAREVIRGDWGAG